MASIQILRASPQRREACSRDLRVSYGPGTVVRRSTRPRINLQRGNVRGAPSKAAASEDGGAQPVLSYVAEVTALSLDEQRLPLAAQSGPSYLGSLFLALLPGRLYYLTALVMPIGTLAAGLGAVYGSTAAAYLTSLPAVQALGPVATALNHLATTQPWSSLLCVLCSMLSAYYAFIIMPLLDLLLGRDARNPTEEEAVTEATDLISRSILYAYAPLHLGVIATMCHLLCTVPTHPLAFLGATFSTGVAGGILFTVAHELLHSTSRLEVLLANALLSVVGYMHWTASHLAHHAKVATVEDPATARSGESLYHFIPRSVWGNLLDGYRWEARRLKAKHIPFLSPRNRMLWWVGCPAAIAGVVQLWYGWKGLAFAVGQAVVSIVMLEAVNYIEHYGLLRRKGADGRYERVGPQHSWNASQMFTNAATFKLQRHSDHHMCSNRPYQLLRDMPEAPQLPLSYPGMIVLSVLPPLFFHVMGPRISATGSAQDCSAAAVPLPAASTA